jgi:hypothetical protein|uniref:Uncharacterized protein n=1 Tax=viral metagenome TaxID=1070528 RepID=A0A6C0CZE8_9ZZZZ
MLSKSIQKSLYKEVCSDVVGRLSVGLGVSKESLMGLLLEEREEVLDGCSKVLDGGGGSMDGCSKVLGSSVLPWCGFVIEECCRGLKLNNGLHTQCNRSRGEKDYCMSCVKLMEKNGGSLPYGSVDDRLKCDILDYIDPKGKATIPFANVMKKLNISKEEALKEAEKLGWTIPECHFEEKKGKRGRPSKAKDTSAEDTASECSEGEKKKRGRPKKNKEVVSNNAGEDLIASLLEQENTSGADTKGKEEEELIEEEVEEEDEDETKVIKFDIEGKTYLKSEDNVLYDMESHDAIGLWNDETKKIEEIPDEDED